LKHLEDPKVGMVGPVTNFVGNEARVQAGYRSWAEMEEFSQNQTWENHWRIADIHMLAMFCVALRRNVFEEVGELDEQFGVGMFEDDDYSIRVKQKGYRVVCAADAFVHHFGQAAFGKLIRTGHYDRIFDENRARFERKWNIKWTPHKNAELEFFSHQTEICQTEICKTEK
jgi:GT2 family glycosyltransferase